MTDHETFRTELYSEADKVKSQAYLIKTVPLSADPEALEQGFLEILSDYTDPETAAKEIIFLARLDPDRLQCYDILIQVPAEWNIDAQDLMTDLLAGYLKPGATAHYISEKGDENCDFSQDLNILSKDNDCKIWHDRINSRLAMAKLVDIVTTDYIFKDRQI